LSDDAVRAWSLPTTIARTPITKKMTIKGECAYPDPMAGVFLRIASQNSGTIFRVKGLKNSEYGPQT
jgi:hypothetical protein